MGKPIGSEKTGGRQKGTPNRKTLALNKHFEEIDFILPDQICLLLPQLTPKEQIDVLLKLMEFIYPKRKPSVDTTVDQDIFNINFDP